MKHVVITGSSQGIGLGLAEEFLKRHCKVMLSARSKKRLEQEQKRLAETYGADRVAATPCDVTDYEKVQRLWDEAVRTFGTVDIWINNAGIVNTTRRYWELDYTEIAPVVNTNIIGVMYGSHVALRGMIQQGHGQIYNLEGMGSNDTMRPGFTVYGTTKRAVRYFTESLIEETQTLPVQIGTLGPGIVMTEFLIENMKKMPPDEYEQVRIVYNILADKVETVAPFLAENILLSTKTGVKINWLTDEKASERFNSDEYTSRDLLAEFGL